MQAVKRAWVVHRAGREEARAVAHRILRVLERAGVEAEVHTEIPPARGWPDLVITVGGDGTLLHTAAALYPQEIPIFPVLLGAVGFLSACRAEEAEAGLAQLLEGKAWVEHRARLLGQGAGLSTTALNELALVGPGPRRFVELEVQVAKEDLGRFGGDGVVVATPTGSTAYALAAGGPVILPDVPTFLVVPLCPHRVGLRPVVVSEATAVAVQAHDTALVLADGEPVGVLPAGEKILIRRAPKPTPLVRLPQTPGVFVRLREKLGWS